MLLQWYPDNTSNAGVTPALPILINNKSVIDDIHHLLDELMPTFQLFTPDFNIIQAIQTLITDLPIMVNIFHIKLHQDCDKPFDKFTLYAQMNVLADCYAEKLHLQPKTTIGIFLSWIPGTKAALFHGPSPITSDLPMYIRRVAHEPQMKEYLFKRSKTATNRELQWNDQIYDTIAWNHMGKVIWKLPIGCRIQLSKYMNDLPPTAKQLQTFDNRHDG